MLEIVSKGFEAAKNKLAGKTTLTEENIDEAVRDVRISLLEADVEINVAKTFVERVKQKVLGRVVETQIEKGEKKMRASPAEAGNDTAAIAVPPPDAAATPELAKRIKYYRNPMGLPDTSSIRMPIDGIPAFEDICANSRYN